MLFVRQATNIPVPKLYALYSDPQTGKNYIMMERIAGETLESLWPSLSEQEKDMVIAKLRQYFDELRRLPSPGYFGRLGGRPLLSFPYHAPSSDPAISGPFKTEDALNEALALRCAQECSSPYMPDFYRQSLPHIFRDHKPTFTHGDLYPNNILVQRLPQDSHPAGERNSSDEFKVTIIDWQLSGWYPDHWEYSFAIIGSRWNNDWGLRVGKILDPYYREVQWFYRLYFNVVFGLT
ncbi:hypothetical protein EV182_007502 [Spiromyces aspiralis]|uniref:Uncharacterized protein n=1 Tax=Spiromyces aspiralis TaxID=68401 RepID=A0ACC1H8Q5_9FUNG|nr:hypothetical protein EV182_007502 [Spiromyces aspiralis]